MPGYMHKKFDKSSVRVAGGPCNWFPSFAGRLDVVGLRQIQVERRAYLMACGIRFQLKNPRPLWDWDNALRRKIVSSTLLPIGERWWRWDWDKKGSFCCDALRIKADYTTYTGGQDFRRWRQR